MKNFKQFFLTIILFVSLSTTSFAQFTLGISTGFGMPAPPSTSLDPYFVQVEQNGDLEVLSATLGAGINFNANIGYNFSSNVGLHLNVNYLMGIKGSLYQYIDQIKIDQTFKSNSLSFAPHLTVSTANDSKVNFYAKFGPIISLPKTITEITVDVIPGVSTYEYQKGMALGFLGGLGLDIAFSDMIGLFTELETRMLNWQPKQLANTETTTGLPLDPTVTFSKEISSSSTDFEQQTIALSSIVLNVGVRFKFGE